MKYHTQNLNEKNNTVVGSMFWHGRAWLRRSVGYAELFHCEWLFGKHARDWALTARFGQGDGDDELCLHACIPFLFSFYLCFPGFYRCDECQIGISAHNGGIWLHTFNGRDSSSSDDPWYKRSHVWYYPWSLEHHLTEVLEHKANLPGFALPIWNDSGKKFLESYEARKSAEQSVSETYDYTYTLKSGEVQHRKATVYVDRMTWRARWWPLVPISKVQTCISVSFDDEVGEKSGSWKGGCTGCGYEMKLGETPMECLRRMERERKF
jgi:hypothetical protein